MAGFSFGGALQQALGNLGHFGQQVFQGAVNDVENWLNPHMPLAAGVKSPLPKSESPGGYNSLLQPALANYYNRDYWMDRIGHENAAQQPKPAVLAAQQQRSITPTPTSIPTRIPVHNVISRPITPTAFPTRAPTPTPVPTRTGYQQNITIPYSQGGQYRLQPQLAQSLMNNFGDINQATNAAQVLNHPLQQTYTQREIQQYGHPSFNRGENASFKPMIDAVNTDQQGKPIMVRNPQGNLEPSVDRGLFRINNATFYGIMNNPQYAFWKQAAQAHGINNWDDMNDPNKNGYMARLIFEMGGWGRWFAAPLQLRQQGAPDLQQLSQMIARANTK